MWKNSYLFLGGGTWRDYPSPEKKKMMIGLLAYSSKKKKPGEAMVRREDAIIILKILFISVHFIIHMR